MIESLQAIYSKTGKYQHSICNLPHIGTLLYMYA